MDKEVLKAMFRMTLEQCITDYLSSLTDDDYMEFDVISGDAGMVSDFADWIHDGDR